MAMLQGSNCDQICSVVKETGFTVPVGSATQFDGLLQLLPASISPV